MARVVWEASRADEGTISATGADVVAAALLERVVGPELDRLRAEVDRQARLLDSAYRFGDERGSDLLALSAERDDLRARLAKVEALADEWAAWSCRSEEGHEDSDVQCVSCLSADLRAALASVPEPSDSDEDTYCGVEEGEAMEGDCECPRCIAEPSDSEPAPTEVDSLRLRRELEQARRRLEREAAEPRCPTCGGRGADPRESSKDGSRCPDAFHSEPAPEVKREAYLEGRGDKPGYGPWRCDQCGHRRWVGWAAGPGMPLRAQCVPCGHVQALPDSEPAPDADREAGAYRASWRDAPGVEDHTRTSTPYGPDYCSTCSEAMGDWVQWPCVGSQKAGAS